MEIQKYPAIREYLSQWKTELTPKNSSTDKSGRKPGNYAWYEIQDDVAYFANFEGPKIIFPDICKAPRFSLDNGGNYLTNTAYALAVDDLYLLGILNSRLFWFAIANISIPFGVRAGEYRYRLVYQYMEKVPIRVIDSKDRVARAQRDKVVKLVEQMIDICKQVAATKTPHANTALERRIVAIDRQIDELVYELYGLNDEEVRIIESTTPTALQ